MPVPRVLARQLLKRLVTQQPAPLPVLKPRGAPLIPSMVLVPGEASWLPFPLGFISLGKAVQHSHTAPWARGLAVNSTNTFLSPNHVPSLYSSYFLRLFSSHSLDRSILIQNPSWNLTRCLHMAELNKCLTKLQCEQHSTGSPFLSCFLLSRLSAVTFEPYQPPFHFLKHLIAANARSALSTRFLLQHFMVLSHLILMTSLMRRGPYVQSHFTHEERPGKV